jgi:hypothetical protein
VYTEATGQTLTKEDDYSPSSIDFSEVYDKQDKAYTDFTVDLASEMLTRGWSKVRRQIERGFVKKVKGPKNPLELDAIGNFVNNVSRFEHYKAFYLPVRDVNALLKNEAWRKLVKVQPNGASILKVVERWVQDIAEIGPARQLDEARGILSFFRHQSAVAMIGLNVLSSFRAGLSTLHSIGYGGETENLYWHMDAALRITRHPIEMWRWARKMWPQLKLRFEAGIERELRELGERKQLGAFAKGKMGRLRRAKGIFNKAVLYHYRLFDGIACTLSASAHYHKMLNRTGDVEQAKRYAWEAIENTQPMGDEKDLPHLWRTSEFGKIMGQFQNMINQEYNILLRDVPDVWKTRKAGMPGVSEAVSKTMWIYFWSKLLPLFLLGTAARGFRLPKKKEIGRDLAVYHLVPFFMVGPVIANAIQGYGPVPPALAWGQDILYAAKA